jgi:hypothetical protein
MGQKYFEIDGWNCAHKYFYIKRLIYYYFYFGSWKSISKF